MDENRNSFFHNLLGRHLPVRVRVFRLFLLIAGITDFVAILETISVVGIIFQALPLVVLFFTIVIAFVLTAKFQMHRPAEYVVGFMMMVIVFPCMFFFSGGVHSGAQVWLIASMIYIFLMFKGRYLTVFLVLDVMVDIFVYVVAYTNPTLVMPLDSPLSEYLDSFFGVLVVGIAIGSILKFQMQIYREERGIVEKQKQQLEKMNQSKDLFFANMSKEIITPLNTVMGLNEMILRETPQGKTLEYAKGVKDASKLLLSLVKDILDVSQLEAKELELREEEYSAILLFQDITHMMEILLKDKPIEFYCDVDENIPAIMYGDAKRVLQILTNLLMNATKYTKEGYIAIHAEVTKRYQNKVILTFQVEDTGIGIRKEDVERIFDIYRFGDIKRKGREQGAGLGLTISKHLVDLMHGQILVDSIYTKGSVFTVMIEQTIVDDTPIRDVGRLYKQRLLLPKEYKQRFEAPEARLLIVDDNQMDVDILCQLLSATRIRIDHVSTPEECLRMTMKRYYHVIMVDDLFANGGTIDIARQLKRQGNGLCRDSAMIAMVTLMTDKIEKSYVDGGFDCVMEKPIDGGALEENIIAFLPDDTVEYQSYEVLKEEGMPRRRPVERQKKRVIVTTDCVAEIPKEYLEKYEIDMMYLYIRTPYGRFADTKEIDTDCLGNYLTDDSSEAYADSVSIEEYEEFFIKQLDVAEQVVHISMAARAGKSFSVATDAAKGLGHVHVVDCGHISCGQSLLVIYAAKMAQIGASTEEILKGVEAMSKQVETGFIMPSANVFYRNGYTSAMVANISRVGKLHPVISMRKSALEVTSFVFGPMDYARKRYIQKRLRKSTNINTDIVFISHVGLSVGQVQMIVDEIARHVKFEHVIVQKASFSSACNAGLGTFGFAFLRKQKKGTEEVDRTAENSMAEQSK